MSLSKTCPYCKSSDLDTDPARGDTVCMGCGSVLEENTIVSEVQVQENADGSSSVVGQFVSNEGNFKIILIELHVFTPRQKSRRGIAMSSTSVRPSLRPSVDISHF